MGLAYPIGTYTAKTVENLLNYTDIRYARTIKETEKFNFLIDSFKQDRIDPFDEADKKVILDFFISCENFGDVI